MAVSGGKGGQRGFTLPTTAPGEVLGTAVDGTSGPAAPLTGLEQGENLRRNKVQNLDLAPGLGSGAGGAYTDADITVAATTCQLRVRPTSNGTVRIDGMAAAGSGQTVEIIFENVSFPSSKLIIGNADGPGSRFVFSASDDNQFREVLLTRRFDSVVATQYSLSGSSWVIGSVNTGSFRNDLGKTALDVFIHDGTRFLARQLTPNDLESSVIVVDALSVLDQFKSGDVITLPDRSVVIIDGQFTFPADTRIVLGDDSIFRGYGRVRDSLSFSTPAASPITIPANPGSAQVLDLTCTQTSGTADFMLVSTDANADRIFVRNFEGNCGGRGGFSIAATVVDIASLNLQATSNGVVASGSCTVFVIADALIIQTVGTGGNSNVDFGSSSNKFLQPRLSNCSLVSAASGFNVKGAASNGNMVSGAARGDMVTVNFQGAGTPLDGITRDDLQWMIVGPEGTQASSFEGNYFMTANGTATTISTSGSAESDFVKIAGTTTEGIVHRMNMSTDNQMEIDRLQPATYTIRANISAIKSGSTRLYLFGVFADTGSGFALIQPPMPLDVTGRQSSVTVDVIANLTATDQIEVRVANTENTDNLTVVALNVILVSK